jgi:hypothetical protein
MAKNLGREFATMTEDERRRFALEHPEATDEAPAELEFDDPRDESRVTDPEQRGGMSAQLQDDEHERDIEEGQ